MSSDGFAAATRSFLQRLDAESPRRILLFGGKGGVGKTTISSIAALHLASRGRVILFSTDPASNLGDLFGDRSPLPSLEIEPFDSEKLWNRFLQSHLERFVEIGDRGTYLDRDEIRRLLELAVPGVDELTGWSRIGELAELNPDATIVVDTAPTGHTLRLLSSSGHFRQMTEALEEMQEKHRALVEQLTRTTLHDEIDQFIESFRSEWEERSAVLMDAAATAFIPVLLAEPWVIAQTLRLADEVKSGGIAVPFAVMNRSRCWCDCAQCTRRCEREKEAAMQVELLSGRGSHPPQAGSSGALDPPQQRIGSSATPLAFAPESPFELGTAADLLQWIRGESRTSKPSRREAIGSAPLALSPDSRLVFFAGKGGVGKTTVASSVALQLAARKPDSRFVVISVDPAHALSDVFAHEAPPENLSVEIVDTKGKWERFRQRMGTEIERTIAGLTPGNLSLGHDARVISGLLDTAPPGADEMFAVARLADLLEDRSIERVLVDTAPTGHFLRLLELPREAGEWVRELMRLLLRYKEMVPPGPLAEELLDRSRTMRRIDSALRSREAETIVVARAGTLVENETRRLLDELRGRQMQVGGLVLNAFEETPACPFEEAPHARLSVAGVPMTIIERKEVPPTTLAALRGLVPLE